MEQGRVLQTLSALVMAAFALTGYATAQTNGGAPATWLDGCWGWGDGSRRLTITQQPGGITVTSVDERESGFWRFRGQIDGHPAYGLESGYHLYAPLNNHDHILFYGAAVIDLYRVSGACPAAANSRSRPDAAPAAPVRPSTVASRPAAAGPAPENPARRAAVDAINARNYAEAARLLEPLAEAGAPDAQTFLGALLYNGQGVPRDVPRGIALVRLAAAQNFQDAIAWLARMEARQRATAPANPPAGMTPEIAAAWRAETDPAVRTRIERNAARYAASRPSLVVRANSGSGCIRPSMTNYRFEPGVNGTSETWRADIRLTNSCNSEQFVYADDRMPDGRAAGMPITNVGMFRGRWDQRRDPNVGFRPWNPLGEIPRYRIAAGAEWSQSGLYRGGSTNQVELWIGSCPSHAAGNVTQIGFRPTAYMRDDPRLVCVPGVQGPDRY